MSVAWYICVNSWIVLLIADTRWKNVFEKQTNKQNIAPVPWA